MATLGDGIATLLQDAAIHNAFARQEREAVDNANEWRRHCKKVENDWRQHCKAIEDDRDALLNRLWSELGASGAMHGALRRLVPTHPLTLSLLDPEHRSRASAAGVAAGKKNPRGFEAAFKAGLDLAPPSRTTFCERYDVQNPVAKEVNAKLQSELDASSAENVALRARVAELEAARERNAATSVTLRQTLSEREAEIEQQNTDLGKSIEELARHVALYHAYRSALAASNPDHPTLSDPAAEDFVGRMAFRHLTKDATKPDWEAVREIGENWAMPRPVSDQGCAARGFDVRLSPQETYEDLVDEIARAQREVDEA